MDMRNKKFRAWVDYDEDNKQMIYSEDNLAAFFASFDYNLMQYTGLKDKNGKEIYEGDILKGKDGKINVVVWNDNLSGYILGTWVKEGKQAKLDIETLQEKIVECVYFIADEDEIIGNIYANPDLLKGAKDE